ncbi:hypothetical protein [Paenibacillus arenilitoris]|uniref:Uncharacterized protein n=1 Tax=Paenibacillus arenilitoris TaxID=2772299 RepID=A0A927CPU4_9BACL|nr:hypothetical protein [Paenibacillus arenilitoris]MBD2870877.1 hypothetical protein [Paenibacillus arenilitoris]
MRVHLFLEQSDFKFEPWEEAVPEIKKWIDDHVIAVAEGHNLNHAVIHIQCADAVSLKFGVRDLHREQSPMIAAMEDSVVSDYEDAGFDYWDSIPPFGVVELYALELTHRPDVTEAELEAFFLLAVNFLLNSFMMIAFRGSEVEHVERYMEDTIRWARAYTYQGETCFRYKHPGW